MNHFSEWYEKNGQNVLFVFLFCFFVLFFVFFCRFTVPLLYTGFMKNGNNSR